MEHRVMYVVMLGLAAGILSGLIGIGGGILIVPGLIFLFGFVQSRAQGTTLAMMVPPIGILAAWTYYRHGDVDIRTSAFLAVGFIVGWLVGAKIATSLPNAVLEKVFGVALLIISLKMIFNR
jgi:uncharacterized membrane protein YfcA